MWYGSEDSYLTSSFFLFFFLFPNLIFADREKEEERKNNQRISEEPTLRTLKGEFFFFFIKFKGRNWGKTKSEKSVYSGFKVVFIPNFLWVVCHLKHRVELCMRV